MEQTTSTAAPVGVESSITRLLDKVIDQMFNKPSNWQRSTATKGVVGSVSHATDKQLLETEGTVESVVTYTDGNKSFTPSVEITTSQGLCLANVQGSMSLKKGDKVSLTQGSYENKNKETKPCLVVTGLVA